MIVVHHLRVSQSERIIWLLEELGLRYELKAYDRQESQLAPTALRQVHPVGTAPIITDGGTVLAESGAIVEYILRRYGEGRLQIDPESPEYASYLFWLHYSYGSLMPQIGMNIVLERALGADSGNSMLAWSRSRLERQLSLVENRLGSAEYFAGCEFTVADIMMQFSFGTGRMFSGLQLGHRPHIKAYLTRISAREAYQRAMKIAGHSDDPALR
jgi:glutathione S-transferase